MKPQIIITMLCLSLFMVGCAGRGIYVHTVIPLSTNFDNTPVSKTKPEKSDVKHFFWPYPRVDLQWSHNAIGQIAKERGINRVYYADLESLSVLWIWNQYWVHVYGDS